MSRKPGPTNPLEAARRADRRRTILIQVAVAGVLIVLIAAIGVGLALRNSGDSDSVADIGPVPTVATDNGAIRIGAADAETTVRIIADLQCPACQMFEARNGALLQQVATDGTAAVEYNIAAFLDRASSTEYSSRAANASYCVAETGTDNYQKWLQTMFERQPPEGGAGLPDTELVEIAKSAGYTDASIGQCIAERKYDKYIAAKSNALLDEGINSTPSVFVDGKQIQQSQLQSAIAEATGR